MPALEAGTYKARVTGEVVLGESAQKGTPFIEFYLVVTSGDWKGQQARWSGYFTDTRSAPDKPSVQEQTIAALQLCGWDGDNIGEFADGGLHGLDANEVSIVVELEEFTGKDGTLRTSPRVKWINRDGGFLNRKLAMPEAKAHAFAERMRGLVMASKAKAEAAGDDSFAFGANAEAPPKAPSAKKAF